MYVQLFFHINLSIILIPPTGLLPEYRNYYMFSQIEKILKLAYGGAQPNISSKIICELQFLLPPLMEQKRIVQKIEELYSYFDNIQKALEA